MKLENNTDKFAGFHASQLDEREAPLEVLLALSSSVTTEEHFSFTLEEVENILIELNVAMRRLSESGGLDAKDEANLMNAYVEYYQAMGSTGLLGATASTANMLTIGSSQLIDMF